jgi:rhodanese-related sulfurtransferase
MAGYPDVYSMKWGMCSWHADFAGAWNSNISSQYYADYVQTATDKGPEGDLPKLSTGEEEAEDILAERLDDIFAEGIGKSLILHKDLMPDPSGYYIVNYWPEDQYNNPGHIEGAMQYTPKASLTLDTDLKTLPNDKTIVVYCHSGQNSAFLVAYLRTIGYDALSLKFGTNGAIYDFMPVSKWNPDAHVMGYEYDVTQ